MNLLSFRLVETKLEKSQYKFMKWPKNDILFLKKSDIFANFIGSYLNIGFFGCVNWKEIKF